MKRNEELQQLRNMISQYQPIKRKENENEYLCPSKYKSYQTDNELYLLNYITNQQLTENDILTISQYYNINYMSFDYLLFLYLLQYHPITNTINIISSFLTKYSIKSNIEVINIIITTRNQINTDEIIKDSFYKYLFQLFSIQIGRRYQIQETHLKQLLELLYSHLPLYNQFITFLHQKNHLYLTKDQWNCLSTFSQIVFIPQPSEFYLFYTSENSYFYPVLFDEFFLYLKDLLLHHQIHFFN